jgi:tetratricopeptide (TPR) repeat protein
MKHRAPIFALVVATAVSAAIACSSKDAPQTPAAVTYPQDCKGLGENETADCAEDRFWEAFAQKDLAVRQATAEIHVAAIAKFPQMADKVRASRLHFRLGQIRMAMGIENDQRDIMLHAFDLVIGEFDKAMALDPSNGIIAPWKDTMEMAFPAVLGDWDAAVPLAERGFENVPKNKMGNTLSLSGTTIGFPLRTGVPQKTVKLLDEWVCEGADFCTKNTKHAPWARPGLAFHFAEAYARVGDKAKAKQHLEACLAAEGADKWPYRATCQGALADLDGFLAKFAARGEDQGCFDISYANQDNGCVFCHEAAKP